MPPRALLFSLSLLCAGSAYAGCRLSTADCTIIAREIANEEIARIADERRFHPPGMLEGPRGLELLKRHFARKAERYPHIPVRVANEWARMELCDAQADAVNAMDDQQVSDMLNGKTPTLDDPRCY